jgi:carbamoyl-phosphate synthase large subunit
VELNVVGLMNIQYAIFENTVYVLEANPRASRTVPMVSKVCNISMARLATQVMLGKKLADLDLKTDHSPLRRQRGGLSLQHVSRGGSVLGPEMRSTGEVLGISTPSAVPFSRPRRPPRPPCHITTEK